MVGLTLMPQHRAAAGPALTENRHALHIFRHSDAAS